MPLNNTKRVGYVVKRYPRYSETFIVNEILAHEAAGMEIDIFSLYSSNDSYFQDLISKVKAPVKYLSTGSLKSNEFWLAIEDASQIIPSIWNRLKLARGEDVHNIYRAIMLACEVRQRNISHLHAHFASSAATVSRLASLFCNIPYSFTAHAKDIYHDDVDEEEIQKKLCNASSVITVSDYNVRYMREKFGNSAIDVKRIYNGLDLDKFNFSVPVKRKPLIISVGRLVEKKGFKDLIKACSIIDSTGLDFECQIIGAGELENELTDLIKHFGLNRKVSLTGPLPQNEVFKKMQEASVFAAPCVIAEDGNRDGLPTVLIEAIALGTPCVSTNVTGIPEIIKDGETGFVVSQNDPQSLAKSIKKLLVNEKLRIDISNQARKLVEKNFNIKRNAAQLRNFFNWNNPNTIRAVQGALR